jgi:hypothetical protein
METIVKKFMQTPEYANGYVAHNEGHEQNSRFGCALEERSIQIWPGVAH